MPTFTASAAAPQGISADALVLPIFQGEDGPVAGPGVAKVAADLEVDLVQAYADAKLTGARGQDLTVPTFGSLATPTVLLVGVGKKADVDSATVRAIAGRIAKGSTKRAHVVTTLAQLVRDQKAGAAAVVEGMTLGGYRFDTYRSDPKPSQLAEVTLCVRDARAARAAMREAQVIADAVLLARDLVNTPSGDAYPELMAAKARAVAKASGLTCKVYTPAELERGRFGGILGVGKGSVHPPRLVELAYRGGREGQAPIALVGKGITFDSGGLSIKDARNMEWMKVDKAGASAMLATMQAIAQLGPKVNVIALLPFAENMPSGSAQRPGDVITHRNGTTSEVLNTDAEGRLVLADALALAVEREAEVIVDAATLTGAIMVALGKEVTGVFGNDRALTRAIVKAGEDQGEPSWEMPLWKGYRTLIDSPVADIKNIGGPYGGSITAALFLKEFVGDTPWVHMDIAGTAWTDGDALGPKGATGAPVRTLVHWILTRARRR